MKGFLFLLLFFFIPLGFLVLCIYSIGNTMESFNDDTLDHYTTSDYRKFSKIGDQLFKAYDEGVLAARKDIYDSNDDFHPKVEEILGEYSDDVYNIHIVEPDVILLVIDSIFHLVEGLAIRRNFVEPKNDYESTGYDRNAIRYKWVYEDIYQFSAGL